MAYTQASNKAVQKYNKKAYDDLRIRVKKGEGDIIKIHAKSQGESLNSFVVRAIHETMSRDKTE
jgi:predicted HicB family RNase H-like nuclease